MEFTAAMLAAITFLPALMGLLGTRLAPKPGSRAEQRFLAADAKADAKAEAKADKT